MTNRSKQRVTVRGLAWSLLGVVVLLGSVAPAAARRGSQRSAAHSERRPLMLAQVASPDRQQWIGVVAGRAISFNGRRIDSGTGLILGRPVWRRDSQAFSFLQRSPFGLKVVVVLCEAPDNPLIWRLPPLADGMRQLFWIGDRRIGIGDRRLVPRIVVNWSEPKGTV